MLGYFDKVEAVVSKKVSGLTGAACTVTVDNIQMMLNSAKEGKTTSIMPQTASTCYSAHQQYTKHATSTVHFINEPSATSKADLTQG